VFSYQSIGGLAPGFLPNGNLITPQQIKFIFFATNKLRYSNSVDNIPYKSIGNNLFNGGLNIVTEKRAAVFIKTAYLFL
jgi:hypothetical protein